MRVFVSRETEGMGMKTDGVSRMMRHTCMYWQGRNYGYVSFLSSARAVSRWNNYPVTNKRSGLSNLTILFKKCKKRRKR